MGFHLFAAFVNWIQRNVHRNLSRPSESFLTVCLISEIQKRIKLKEIQVWECKFSFIEDCTCVEIPGFSLITKGSAGCGDGPWHLYTVWVHSKLHMGTKKLLSYLRNIEIIKMKQINSVVSRLRELILAVFSALVRPHLGSCVLSSAPQSKRSMHMLGTVQQRATKMSKGLKHLSSEERMRGLQLFDLDDSAWRRGGSGRSHRCP